MKPVPQDNVNATAGGDSRLARFGIGAAQFGMRYGRFNTAGMPSADSVRATLNAAHAFGLSLIDTAYEYGASETVLGECADAARPFALVTKTARLPGAVTAAGALGVRDKFTASLAALRRTAVDGLLVHNADELLSPGGPYLYEQLLALKEAGLVRKIGVSAYTGDEAEQVAERFAIDLVQLPVNWLDQRLSRSGALRRLSGRGIEIHARSAFLQGLLLADPATLSAGFDGVRPVLAAFRSACARAGVSPAHAALHHLLEMPEIARVVVGVESPAQLAELFRDFPAAPALPYADFRCDDIRILNPVLWTAA